MRLHHQHVIVDDDGNIVSWGERLPCPPEFKPKIGAKTPAVGEVGRAAKDAPSTKTKPKQAKRKATKAKAAKAEKQEAAKSEPKGSESTTKAAKGSKPSARKWDLSKAGVRDEYDAAVLDAVKQGAVKASAIPKVVGGTSMQAVAALGRLTSKGELGIVKEGPPAQYRPVRRSVGGKALADKVSLPTLKWRSETRNNRRGQVARWEDGVFRMIEAKRDLWALYFERGNTLAQYGCGSSRAVKKEARQIAAAGMPTPDEWKAMGRKLGACPISTRRITEAGGVRLIWEESIIEGQKVCVAASVAGEWKMRSAEDGSFALYFIRPGGSVESLGEGAMRTLHKRALEAEAAQLEEVAAEPPATDEEGAAEGSDTAVGGDDSTAFEDESEAVGANDGSGDDKFSEASGVASEEEDKKLILDALATALERTSL